MIKISFICQLILNCVNNTNNSGWCHSSGWRLTFARLAVNNTHSNISPILLRNSSTWGLFCTYTWCWIPSISTVTTKSALGTGLKRKKGSVKWSNKKAIGRCLCVLKRLHSQFQTAFSSCYWSTTPPLLTKQWYVERCNPTLGWNNNWIPTPITSLSICWKYLPLYYQVISIYFSLHLPWMNYVLMSHPNQWLHISYLLSLV